MTTSSTIAREQYAHACRMAHFPVAHRTEAHFSTTGVIPGSLNGSVIGIVERLSPAGFLIPFQ